MNKRETIYIAGPECFFQNGDEHLASLRNISESVGHSVSLPNDTPLKLDNEDLRLNADEIFQNLEEIIYDTTMIISDLDIFRGSEPDSGTVYEIGMAYARGLISYGYTRDIRPLVWKDPLLSFDGTTVFDEHGDKHYYSFLPFSPAIMASTKVIEGKYTDVLNIYNSDKYYGHQFNRKSSEVKDKTKRNSVFIITRDYYDETKFNDKLSSLAEEYTIVEPYFRPYDENESISEWLDELLIENTKRIDQSEFFVADLNDYRGKECSNDVAFYCGYAFQIGKKMYGFMDDTSTMLEKIPHKEIDGKFKDIAMRDVENFDYPINLMFASSMKITEGRLEEALREIIKS